MTRRGTILAGLSLLVPATLCGQESAPARGKQQPAKAVSPAPAEFRPEYWIRISPAKGEPGEHALLDGRDTVVTLLDASRGLPGRVVDEDELAKLGIGRNEFLRRVGRAADGLWGLGVACTHVPASGGEPAHCLIRHESLPVAPLMLSKRAYLKCKETLGENLVFLLMNQNEIRVYGKENLEQIAGFSEIFAERFRTSDASCSSEIWLKEDIDSNPIAIGAFF